MDEFLTQEEMDKLLDYAGDMNFTTFRDTERLVQCTNTFNNRDNYSKKN